MKSKTSCFSVSPALIRLDLKRHWPLPIMIFIGYFLSGLFILMANYGDDTVTAALIGMILKGSYLVYSLILALSPVLVSAIIIHYLDDMGSVMSVHSQPFSRYTLINSHAISCAMFCLLPVFAAGLILLALAHPVYFPQEYYANAGEMSNLFTRTEVLRWILDSSLITLFVLSICIFARMITGTGVHHVVAAIGFNVVVPILILLSNGYMEQYVYGFTSEDTISRAVWSSPVMEIYTVDHFSPLACLLYIAAAAVIYALSSLLYQRRKLERTTEGIVFETFNYIINMIWGFLGMTFLGFIFRSIFTGLVLRAAGYVIGAVLGIVICRMIVAKSLRVFNRTTMRIMGVYAVAAALFFGVLLNGLAGYETRIARDADSASVSGLENYVNESYGVYISQNEMKDLDPESVREAHRYLIDHKSEYGKYQSSDDFYVYSDDGVEQIVVLNIRYYRGEECVQIRRYRVPLSDLMGTDSFRNLVSSDQYRAAIKDALPALDQWHVVRANNYNYNSYGVEDMAVNSGVTDEASLRSLYNAYCSDIDEWSGEDALSGGWGKDPVVTLELTYVPERGAAGAENAALLREPESVSLSDLYDVFTLSVYGHHEHTLAWLREHGYDDILRNTGYYADAAAVSIVTEDSASEITEELYGVDWDSLRSDPDLTASFEDPAELEQLYDRFIPISLLGGDLTTEKDNMYLVRFFFENYESGGYDARAYGYISGDDLNEIGKKDS